MTRYFAHVDGDVIGPHTPDELKPHLRPDIYVCLENGNEWILAPDIPELKAVIPRKYYALLAGNSAGPYTKDELDAIVQPDLMLCTEGESAWIRAGEHPDFAARWKVAPTVPVSSSTVPGIKGPPKDLPPKLQELWRICRNASTELLSEQQTRYRKQYFKNERKIIDDELARRGPA